MLPPTNRLLDNWDPVGNGYLRALTCGFNPALYVHVRRLYYVLLCSKYIHIKTKKRKEWGLGLNIMMHWSSYTKKATIHLKYLGLRWIFNRIGGVYIVVDQLIELGGGIEKYKNQ